MTEVPGEPTIDTDNAAADEPPAVAPADLDRITQDFDGVDAALRRLDDGSYWSDEITGAEIPDEVLAINPVARRTETP